MISLITATLGRINEVERLLVSLSKQTYKDFEIIIVDQNEHLELEKLVSKFNNLNLVYLRSSQKGLSLNRNIGLSKAKGDIIGFPDDDCFYEDNLLSQVFKVFSNEGEKCKMVAVEAKDISSEFVFIKCDQEVIHRNELFKKCISYNFFIRRIDEMKFDERLGVGAEFGSGEETDFLWTFFNSGDICKLINTTCVHHPGNIGAVNPDRAYKYGLGYGAIMKKEILYRHHYNMAIIYLNGIIRAFGGFLLKKEKKSYYNSLLGRVKGFCMYKSL